MKRYSLPAVFLTIIMLIALSIGSAAPINAQIAAPMQATTAATAVPTDISIGPANPTATPTLPLIQGTTKPPNNGTINGTPIGPLPAFKPPTTLEELVKQYPDLKPYIDKLSNSKVGEWDFSELYKRIAQIFNDKGAAAVGVFLKDSGLLEKLGLPVSYLDLLTAYDKGGLDAVIKLARQRQLINSQDEVVGYLSIDSKDNLDAVKADLDKLAVSTYDYLDNSDELEIGVPLAVLQQFGTPGPLIKYLTQIATINHVIGFRAPTPSIKTDLLYLGGQETKGAQTIGADKWHQAGITGKGIRIGVLDMGFGGVKDELGKTLPKTVMSNVSLDRLNGQEENHGTACAEVAHGAAPDAELYLAFYDSSSSKSLASAVDWLVKNKVQIITHSASTLVGPRNGTSDDAVMVDKLVRDTGILWVNSAGNYAQAHAMFKYHEGTDGTQEFDNGETAIPFIAGTSNLFVALNWDGNWNGGETSEYDFTVYDKDNNEIANGNELRKGRKNDYPYQFATFDAEPGKLYYLSISRNRGKSNNVLDIFIPNTEFADWAQSPAYSVSTPGDAGSALTVGATGLTKDILESYSSQGPTQDERIKPDLVAPTGEVLPGYPVEDGGFAGTSGAAPLVAGAAALVYQKFPDLSAPEVKAYLVKNVKPLDKNSPDPRYGSGRLALPDPGGLNSDNPIGTPIATPVGTPGGTPRSTPGKTPGGTPEATSSADTSSAKITNINTKFNVKVGGVKGFEVDVSFDLNNYKGKQLAVVVIFETPDGKSIPSADSQYQLGDTLATVTFIKPKTKQTSFKDVSLFIPNAAFAKVKQKDLIALVAIADMTNKDNPVLLTKSDPIKIKITTK